MTSDTSFGPDQMEEGVHAWTSPCNPDPLKPGVKLMAGCNSAGVGVTSVSLPVAGFPAGFHLLGGGGGVEGLWGGE